MHAVELYNTPSKKHASIPIAVQETNYEKKFQIIQTTRIKAVATFQLNQQIFASNSSALNYISSKLNI
jgi:hypothetical protein